MIDVNDIKEKTRTEYSIRNLEIGAIGQVVNIILSFIVRTIFVKTLNENYLGVNGLFTNILTILSFAELGIGSAIIYNMYKPIANNDKEKIKSLMHFYKITYRIIGLFILICGILIIPFLNDLIKEKPNIPENLTDAKEIGRLNEKAESTAVVNAGGFYISRYEMAKDEDENLVSKKGTVAEFSESIDNLKSISKNFSTSSPNLKSALCSGIQWDVVMDLVKEKTGFDVNVVHDEFYTNGKQPAGTNPENKFFNIYDLEGNCLEYTSEQISSFTYIERGGDKNYPASARLTGQEIMDGYGDSFRLVLYII